MSRPSSRHPYDNEPYSIPEAWPDFCWLTEDEKPSARRARSNVRPGRHSAPPRKGTRVRKRKTLHGPSAISSVARRFVGLVLPADDGQLGRPQRRVGLPW
jgi:hypothetical protein